MPANSDIQLSNMRGKKNPTKHQKNQPQNIVNKSVSEMETAKNLPRPDIP